MQQPTRNIGREPGQTSQRGQAHVLLAEAAVESYSEIFVRQIRAGAHAKPKTRGALRALGLRRIGHTNRLPNRPSVWGNITQAEHYIECQLLKPATPDHDEEAQHSSQTGGGDAAILTEESDILTSAEWTEITSSLGTAAESDLVTDPHSAQDASPRSDREVGGGVNAESFPLDQLGTSDRLQTDEGDSIWHVRYEQGGSSITWPTALSPLEFFTKALERVKVSNGSHHAVEVYGPNETAPTHVKIVELAEMKPEIVRLENDETGVAFGWQLTAFDGKGAEGGIVAQKAIPLRLLEDLLETTASGSIKDRSHELATRVVELEAST